MSPRLEREAAADDVAEYAVANHIGLRDFSPIRPSIPCQRPPATRAHVVTLSGSRIKALCQSVEDALLAAHLGANDATESLEASVRDNLTCEHIGAAFDVVRARKDLTYADKALLDLIVEEAFVLAMAEVGQ